MFASDSLRVSDYAPLGAMEPHSHDAPSFGMVVHGDFLERIGKSERHYRSGCVTFGPAGITHSQNFGAEGARQIIIRPEDAWLAYLSDSRMRLSDAPYAQAPLFQRLGQRLLGEIAHEDEFSNVAREGIVLEIIAAFGRAAHVVDCDAKPPAWLAAVRDFLHANAATTPLTMKRIARAAGRHEIHLAREFRRYFGVSVGAYLRQVRTERAAHLLRNTGSGITEVALDCGFASHAHLCRVFKAHFGVSPSQYRARH
ncbi:MAG: helix-turn-helix domain-containing protein [Proteobacteria bacterium]|nr:helix-turn-helix domain-containing protein [Pseudomonadota bacterium]